MTDHQATVKRFDIPYVIFAVGGMLQREGSQTMVRAEDYDALHAEVEALRQQRDAVLAGRDALLADRSKDCKLAHANECMTGCQYRTMEQERDELKEALARAGVKP